MLCDAEISELDVVLVGQEDVRLKRRVVRRTGKKLGLDDHHCCIGGKTVFGKKTSTKISKNNLAVTNGRGDAMRCQKL